MIEPYLVELINYYKNKGEWKIQLTTQTNFISSRPDSNETRVMHTRSDNEEFMNGSDTDEIIKELFKSLLQRYQENLQEKTRGSVLPLKKKKETIIIKKFVTCVKKNSLQMIKKIIR